MKRLFALIVLLALSVPAFTQKKITLDDCFFSFRFYPEYGPDFQYLSDGHRYAEIDERNPQRIHLHDVRRPDFDSTLTLELPEEARGYDQFEFSADDKLLVLRTETVPVYRHSVLARYFVYDFASRKTQAIAAGNTLQFFALSPDGKRAAFVRDNNVFWQNLADGTITQVTTDGRRNAILNGLPDWLYEEEFSPSDGDGMLALQWSPNSEQIAFLRFDESKVPQYRIAWYEGEIYPRDSVYKYPKVGEPNAIVTAHIHDLRAGKTKPCDTGNDPTVYLPRLYWTPDGRLAVLRTDRYQRQADIVLFTYKNGGATQLPGSLIPAESDDAYADVTIANKLVFLKNSPHYLWMDEKSGFNRVTRYPMNPAAAEAPIALTPAGVEVMNFYGIDEKTGKLYYQTASPTPMDRQVWEASLSGGEPRLLTPKIGWNDVVFSPDFQYFTHTWSDANTAPVITLERLDGTLIETFTDNRRHASQRSDFGFGKKEFVQIPIGNGISLNAWILKPANFDPNKKYALLIDIYGGPGSQTVKNEYDGFMGPWHQMLAQEGILVASVDNRGTGGRGRDFKKCTQLQLGNLETQDQISAAKWFAQQPYIDGSRIGIWGWSFGGYLSTSCILKGPETFKMAMAVAPVTNWKWYDSAYTERFMHGISDNKSGYEDNSPINFVKNLKGGNYLVCHGSADDNVHWQHSVELINALIAENKEFETCFYPNRNHGISGDNATRHLFGRLTAFLKEKL